MSSINNPVAPGINLRLIPVDQFITEGVAQKCRQIFCPHVTWLTSTDKMQVIQRMFGNTAAAEYDTSMGRVYPYLLLTLSSISLSPDRLNSRYTASRGLPAVVTTDGNHTYNVNFLPARFAVTAELYTQRLADVTEFATRWLFAARQNLLAFEVGYGRASFSVTVELDDNVAIPQRDATTGSIGEYVATVTMTVHGYVSESVLIEAPVARELSITETIATTSGTVGPGSVWTFRNRAVDEENSVPVTSDIR